MSNSVNPFGFSRPVLYLAAGTLILIGGFVALSLLRVEQQQAAIADATPVPFVACNFTNTGAESIQVYSAPFADDIYAIDEIPPSVPYPVTRVNSGYLYIELRQNYGGYVDQFRGLTTGDCDVVPAEDRPATDFATVCRFTPAVDATLYRTAALEQAADRAPADVPLVVMLQSSDAYFVAKASGLRGWVPAQAGATSGACGIVPDFTPEG